MLVDRETRSGVQFCSLARDLDPAIAFTNEYGRLERDGGKPLKSAHLPVIEVGGEDDPSEQIRSQHGRGDKLTRMTADIGDAARAPFIEWVPQPPRLVHGNAGGTTVNADHESR